MFRYYDSKPDVPLYDPYVMRDFCEKHSPGLFDLPLKAITRNDNRLSSEREHCKSKGQSHRCTLFHIIFRFDPNTFALKRDDFWLKIMSMSDCRMIHDIFTDILVQKN